MGQVRQRLSGGAVMSAAHDTAYRARVPFLIRDLVCEAHANLLLARDLKARGVPPKESFADLFASADVVVLLYPEDDDPCGIGYAVPKGRAFFDASVRGELVDAYLIPISVASAKHAWAIGQMFGDDLVA